MGGGIPLIEANRIGCDVYGFDINPMSAWIVREEIEHLDMDAYEQEAAKLLKTLRAEIEDLYNTDCPLYGDTDVPVKYFLWVKVLGCEACGTSIDLFPGYLLSEDSRHPKNVLICPGCGDLNEVDDAAAKMPGACQGCNRRLCAGKALPGAIAVPVGPAAMKPCRPFSTMLVQASERRSSCGRPRRMTVRISSSPSRMLPETPGSSCSRRRTRLRKSRSALFASSWSQA